MTRPQFATRLREGDAVKGTFLNLGSALTAEIAGQAGFDFVLLDLEHGSGDYQQLLGQMQGLSAHPTAALVRVAWNEAWMVKRVLDAGAHGVMMPYVNTPEEARRFVMAMRYPPEGIRGVAGYNRACQFGPGFDAHFKSANADLIAIAQIETAEAVQHAEAIAATEGVDVLFVGPADLSVGLGIPKQFEHPEYRAAVRQTVAAARGQGKQAGTLVFSGEQIPRALEDGFTFIAIGSDSGAVVSGLRQWSSAFEQCRLQQRTPPQAILQERGA